MKSVPSPRRAAFSLLELVIVMTILAVLIGIIYTATSGARLRSDETVCLSNLRQIGLAIKMYQSDHDELPPKLTSLHPQYSSSPLIFRCPAWEALFSARPPEEQAELKAMFTMYSYVPEEKAFWQSVPPEPGDPPSLREGWEVMYKQGGERTPLVLCQFHDPLLEAKPSGMLPDGRFQIIRTVLRMDGSVEKAKATGRRISWSDL